MTVPYGRAADIGWQRIFDADALDALIDGFGPAAQEREIFMYHADGWQRSTQEEAADAVYRDHFSDPTPDADRAVAARAIACLTLKA